MLSRAQGYVNLEDVRSHSGMIMLLGILEMVAGIIVIGLPMVIGVSFVLIMGVMLLLSGILEVFGVLGQGKWWSRVLLGVIGIIGGLFILAQPLFGLAFLNVLIMTYFIASGVARIMAGFQVRGTSESEWLMLGGLISLIFGILMMFRWPEMGMWVLGLLVGVNILISGMMNFSLALEARRLTK